MIRDRRSPLRLATTLSRWLLSMFEEKRDNGLRRLSMTRCAVAAFTIAEVLRFTVLREPLGWPDAWFAFAVLFALPIGKALDRATPDKLVEAVMGAVGRGGSGPGYYTASTTRMESFAPEGPGVLGPDDLVPPVTQGRPDDGGTA